MKGLSKAQLHPFLCNLCSADTLSVPATAQTHATKFTTNLEKLSWGLPLCQLQVNLLNIYTARCLDFILRICHVSDYISQFDPIYLVLFTFSFSVVWQLPSPAWIPHRTRVERTVSFVYMSVPVCDETKGSEGLSFY